MYNHRLTIKPILVRMNIFNTQIFYTIYDSICKDNVNMNINYLDRNFNNLYEIGLTDKFITDIELSNFYMEYTKNIYSLYNKILQ